MKFENVQEIFYRHIPRRYHRFCRELFSQLYCLNLQIKSAYLFDLFPFSLEKMRSLLNDLSNDLSFQSIILKYSLNDLIIVNRCQLEDVINRSAVIIDLTTMTITDSHPMLDKIRYHLSWIKEQSNKTIDFDNEANEDWSNLIETLNHTTVFGYLLGYPIVYYYSSMRLLDVMTLKNFRLNVKINDFDDEVLLYSFSCPIHENIDRERMEFLVNQWFSTLSLKMDSIGIIKHCRLDKQIREQSTWCL